MQPADGKRDVLLIEGDFVVANQMMGWLADWATVTHVTKDSDILSAIKMHTWDLVITDIQLPTLNDLDVTKLVRLKDPFTPVLIVTEHQKINFILDALQNHADGLLFKPLQKAEFTDLAIKLVEDYDTRVTKIPNIVLAIGAHPDDVEIGCGGTLARHAAKKDEIHILTLSLGEGGGDPRTRKHEAENAAEIQGARLYFANLVDTEISEGVETIKWIEDTVQLVKPTHVYTHSIHDSHRDHRNAHHATISACRQVPNLFCYQSPSSTVDFKPNLFMEIVGEFLEKKIEAIACYHSQCMLRPYLQEDLIRATARYWGRFSNYWLVEPMEVIRQKIVIR